MSENWNGQLRPFAIHIAGIERAIRALADSELVSLYHACNKATETNCWWAEYQAAQQIKPIVSAALRDRKQRAQKTIKALTASEKAATTEVSNA